MIDTRVNRAYYSNSIAAFRAADAITIRDRLSVVSIERGFQPTAEQQEAWDEEIGFLKEKLKNKEGTVYLEFEIPRLGRRIDAVVILGPAIFVLEFKVHAKTFSRGALDQVWDYALDLASFHETSHEAHIVPILISTGVANSPLQLPTELHRDNVFPPARASESTFLEVVDSALRTISSPPIEPEKWEQGRYSPSPTIIEAAEVMYRDHAVEDISRNDAEASNLSHTSAKILEIIERSRERKEKAICFVTGVPGAGKTLVGLNVATRHYKKDDVCHSVYLSGNGPLVDILREALARDEFARAKAAGQPVRKGDAYRRASQFIQNVHTFRDECIKDPAAPDEHVVLFDEAQRAWDLKKTLHFMKRRKKDSTFKVSESQYLISCMDRHKDWATITCLVGGGQEIHTGEAGISEWLDSVVRAFPGWRVCISSQLRAGEYGAGEALKKLDSAGRVEYFDDLHLATSLRSFRSSKVSEMIHRILNRDQGGAKELTQSVLKTYPIKLTRSFEAAKRWLKEVARGSQRYGIVASSSAERLRPHAIHVRAPINPVHWFLSAKEDTRSSYYLEDSATEFQVQGLELDWTCVAWDADLRYAPNGWEQWAFKGSKWNRVRNEDRKRYQVNAYRVLLTRARRGMVIVVPEGSKEDPTRNRHYYDPTFNYLREIGLEII